MDYKAMLGKLLENMRKSDPERLARLEDLGYDTSKVWLHGSPRADIKQIGDLVNVYRSNQEKVADAVTKQVTQPFGEADEIQKTIMRFGLDPVNLVPGAPGAGLGVLEMIGKND